MTAAELVFRLADQPDRLVLHYQGKDYCAAELFQVAQSLASDSKPLLSACDSQHPWDAMLGSLAAAISAKAFFPFDGRLPKEQLDGLMQAASQIKSNEKPCWLIATSGTSKAPRLVALGESQVLASIQASQRRLGLHADDCWLCCLPLHHVGGLMIPWRCLHAGARMVLMDRFDAAEFMALLGSQRVTHVSLVPTMLAKIRLLDTSAKPPPSLRLLLLGGATLPAELACWALELGWPLCPTYGMSETASQIATQYPPARSWQPGMAGAVLDHMQMRIRDGRIQVRGDSLMLGYAQADGSLHRPLTDDGWFDTGDLGQIQDGCLYLLGRADEVIVSGGENIHPALVERELQRMPGIGELLVTAKPDALWGQVLHLLYTGTASSEDISTWCRANLPAHYRPKSSQWLEALPVNGMGKLSRRFSLETAV